MKKRNKGYEVFIYAQRTIEVFAKTPGEARKKARIMFKKNPGKLDIQDTRQVWDGY